MVFQFFNKLLTRTLRVLKRWIRNGKINLLIGVSRISPFSSKYFGVPKGFYLSSKEYHNVNKTDQSLVYTSFLPSSAIERKSPTSFFEKIHRKFSSNYSFTTPETFIISIPNGRVIGDMGTVITHDDKLLLDVSMQFGVGLQPHRAKSHSVFSRLKLPPVQQIPKTVAVLGTHSGGTYYHWLMDALPRLEILKQSHPNGIDGIDKFLVNEGIPALVESLELLKIPSDKLIFINSDTHIEAKTLIAPSLPGFTCNPPIWVCDYLRANFLKLRTDGPSIPRLYISRSKARYRRVENEEKVRDCLVNFGFTPVHLEDYDFPTQISIFSKAEIIVAPHGAGLTNLVWCEPKTIVLELFSPNYLNLCFWAIANHVEVNYFFLIGEGERPADSIDPYLIKDNMEVSIEKLSQSVNEILTIQN